MRRPACLETWVWNSPCATRVFEGADENPILLHLLFSTSLQKPAHVSKCGFQKFAFDVLDSQLTIHEHTQKIYCIYIYIHNCPGLKDRTTSTHTQCPTSHLEPRSPRRNRLRRILLVNTSKPERCPPTLRMRARRERLFVRAGLNGVSRPRGAMNGEIFRHCPNSSAARHLFPLHGLIRKILIFKHCTSK